MVKRWSAAALAATGVGGSVGATNILGDFEKFVSDYGREYESVEEWQKRFDIFQANVLYIMNENSKNHSYSLGINQFTDVSQQEFASTVTPLKTGDPSSWASYLGEQEIFANFDAPPSLDWVSKGAVTPVKNQGQCGSCWSFSTTGALEGAWFKATGSLVSLSEQQLVSCDTDGNDGCGGGFPSDALDWEARQSMVCTEESYPYTSGQGSDGSCQGTSGCRAGIPQGGVQGHKSVQSTVTAVMQAVVTQPVSICVNAGGATWQSYRGGVVTEAQCPVAQLDHAVLLVGYGTSGGQSYFKVKNSWAASWGEQGYIRLQRGSGINTCGMLNEAVLAVVSGSPSPSPSPPGPSPGPTPYYYGGPSPGPTPYYYGGPTPYYYGGPSPPGPSYYRYYGGSDSEAVHDVEVLV